MTLQQIIYDKLIADADLTAIVGTDIYYDTLPANWNFKNPAVVFSLTRTAPLLELSGDVFGEDTDCTTYAFSPDSIVALDIAAAIALALRGTSGGYNYGVTSQEDQDRSFELNTWQVESITRITRVVASVPTEPPPSVSNLSILGTIREFETVTANYDYSDPGLLVEQGSSYRWFIATAADGNPSFIVEGATAKTFTIPNAYGDIWLSFEVTPRNSAGANGNPVRLTPYEMIAENTVPTATDVTFVTEGGGAPIVGQGATSSYTFVDAEGDAEGATHFQWWTADDGAGLNALPYPGGVGENVVAFPADTEGKFISFEVIPVDEHGQEGIGVLSPYQGPVLPGGGGYSPQAQAIFDRMVDALATETKDKWAVFIDAEYLNGNAVLWDDFWFAADNYADSQPLTEANALVGWLASQAVKVGTVTKGVTGWNVSSAGAIDSGYQPSILPGDQYDQDDLSVGAFVDANNPIQNSVLFALDRLGGLNTFIRQQPNESRLQYGTSGSSSTLDNELLSAGSMFITQRLGPNAERLSKNAATLDNSVQGSVSIALDNLFFGQRADNSARMEGAITCGVVGASGMDLSLFQTNLMNFLFSLDIFAGPIIDSFPNPLVAAEEDAIRTFIHSQLVNFGKKDSFAHFGLQDPINSLWDWKRAVGWTAVNAPAHTPGIGYYIDPATTQYIDTNFIPDQHGINFQLNNARAGAFVVNKVAPGPFSTLFGANLGAAANFQMGTETGRPYLLNAAQTASGTVDAQTDDLVELVRPNATNHQTYLNGVLVDNNARISGALSDVSVYVGNRNKQSVADSPSFEGILSSFGMGGDNGFDHVSYDADLRILNAALAAI